MQKALVTGATGFIGRALIPSLVKANMEVSCLVRPTSDTTPLRDLGCDFVLGDVTQDETLPQVLRQTKPDFVFHLAGLTKSNDRQQLFTVNETGTRNLMTACGTLESPPTVLMVSSLAAAGPAKRDSPRTEGDNDCPISYYGKSKLAAELTAKSLCNRVPLTIVRPPIVFGPHDRDTLEMFRAIQSTGFHMVPTWSKFSVSWIQVQDVCSAFVHAAIEGQRVNAQDPSSGVYYATSPEHVDYGQLGRQIGEAVGRRRVWCIPTASFVIWAAASVNEIVSRMQGKTHIFNFDKAREATAGSWLCNGEKLALDTKFRCNHSLAETLRTSTEWYRNAGWLRAARS